jgi:hypothetical protein
MNNRDAYFFVGKCLTLWRYPEHISEIRETISEGNIEWEKIVWVSTSHLVFPALCLQLKRAGLTSLLPSDLVEYMVEFTSVNRDRNQQIIGQANEITSLLNKHGLSPVFLKGTAHLLQGLYEDIAERMVGDIDFLVYETDMERAAAILMDSGYKPLYTYIPENVGVLKHYSRLVNDERIAAVEIHHQVFSFPDNKLLDAAMIIPEGRKLNLVGSAFIPNEEHQIIYNILNVQMSEAGYYYGRFRLSQMNDLLHLSLKTDPLSAIKKFGKSIHPLYSNLALASKLMGIPAFLPDKMSFLERFYVSRVLIKINSPRWARFSERAIYFVFRFINIVKQIGYTFVNSKMRRSVIRRATDATWYKEHIKSYAKR